MGVRRYQDLIAWQMADAFKREVFRLVTGSSRASSDQRYRNQPFGAAESAPVNIAEGFLRNAPAEFRRFLGISLGSLAEAESRLRDGIQLGYLAQADCDEAFRFARRATVACVRLKASQLAFLKPSRTPRT